VLKHRTYSMAVIDGVFCLDVRVTYKRERLSVVALKLFEIIRTYNTPGTTVRNRRSK